MLEILDPTHETTPPGIARAARPATLAGKRIAFISNGKEGTAGFFKHMDRLLRERFQVAETRLLVKSNYSAPADDHIMESVRGFDLAISGLGD
jgi:hypothetical protein